MGTVEFTIYDYSIGLGANLPKDWPAGQKHVRITIPDTCPCGKTHRVVDWPGYSSSFQLSCTKMCYGTYSQVWEARIKGVPAPPTVCANCESEKCDCDAEIWNIRCMHPTMAPTPGLWVWNNKGQAFRYKDIINHSKSSGWSYGPIQRITEPAFDFSCTIDQWKAKVRGVVTQPNMPLVRPERPCKLPACKAMNDVGVKVCWRCGNDPA